MIWQTLWGFGGAMFVTAMVLTTIDNPRILRLSPRASHRLGKAAGFTVLLSGALLIAGGITAVLGL